VSLHKYLYAHADPSNNVDPSGYFSLGEAMTTINTSITIANNAITTYNWIFGNPDSDAVDGVPSIWDVVMSIGVKAVATQLAVASAPAPAVSFIGATEEHHAIPVYCCGAKKQRLVTLPIRDHNRIHRELNRFATLIDVAGKGVDLLVYKRPSSVFRKTPLQRLGRTRVGRAAILAGLQAFYAADGSLGLGVPPMQAALAIEGPRFVGTHHSAPRCRR